MRVGLGRCIRGRRRVMLLSRGKAAMAVLSVTDMQAQLLYSSSNYVLFFSAIIGKRPMAHRHQDRLIQ